MARLPTSTSPYDYLPVKYPPLAPQDLDTFLKERFVAQLATVSKDGSPHVKPIWFNWDGEKVWMITWLECKTVSNIQHNNRVAVSVDSSRAPVTSFPDMGCLIHGEAELVPEIKNKVDPRSWHFINQKGPQGDILKSVEVYLKNQKMKIAKIRYPRYVLEDMMGEREMALANHSPLFTQPFRQKLTSFIVIKPKTINSSQEGVSSKGRDVGQK